MAKVRELDRVDRLLGAKDPEAPQDPEERDGELQAEFLDEDDAIGDLLTRVEQVAEEPDDAMPRTVFIMPPVDQLVRKGNVLYRRTFAHTGHKVLKDGVLYNEQVELHERRVARTLAEAKAMGWDWWNGSTWIRNGLKQEAEHKENLGRGQVRQVILERASSSDQAVARREAAREAALGDALDVVEDTRGV